MWWNNIPAPYMVERFNALADRDSLDFEAWFSRRDEPGRSWNIDESLWRFAYRYMPSIRWRGRPLALPPAHLLRHPPDVLVGFYSEPAMLAGVRLAALRGARTALWAQVTPAAWQRRRPWKEAIKRFAIRGADATFGHGNDSRAFAMRYGASAQQARALPHAVDVERFASVKAIRSQRRQSVRQRRGISGYCVLYVGRLWRPKGVFDLLRGFEAFNARQPSSHLFFVGDGPDQQELKDAARPLGARVSFAGFLDGQDLLEAYAAADLFAFPSHGDPYGLVVDEALAAGLPVVASDVVGEIRSRLEPAALFPAGDYEALARGLERAMRGDSGGTAQTRYTPISPAQWAINFEQEVVRLVGH